MDVARRRLLYLAAGAAALPAGARITQAQSYPSRPVRLIVGLAAGGGQDIVARLMGQWLSERLGRQFIVENRPGAGGNIGFESVVRAAPDGYTLSVCGSTELRNEILYNDLKFSFMLLGWSTGTGEASSALKALLMTYNRDKGYGTANRGRYSNSKVDALTEDALHTVDDVKREAYLQRATELAINDTGIIPLHFQVNLWATRDGITYTPRVDELTLAWKFRPAGAKDVLAGH